MTLKNRRANVAAVLCLRQDAALGGAGANTSLHHTSCLVSEMAAPPVQPHPEADLCPVLHRHLERPQNRYLIWGYAGRLGMEMTFNVYSLCLWKYRHGAHRL